MFTLNNGAVLWKNFKQYTVTDLVCEVEYVTASDAAKEAIWLQRFIDELEVALFINDSVLLYYDSTRAIAQVKKSKSH